MTVREEAAELAANVRLINKYLDQIESLLEDTKGKLPRTVEAFEKLTDAYTVDVQNEVVVLLKANKKMESQ